MKRNDNESRTALKAAADMATLMHEYIRKHEELHTMGMTVVGLATEMMLCQYASMIGKDSDEMSEEYRRSLVSWHETVKQAMDLTNQKAN